MAQSYEPDARWPSAVLHAAFFLLLGGALTGFLVRHPGDPLIPWIIALPVVLTLLYVLGPTLGGTRAWSARWQHAWLGLIVVVWTVLVLLAPSFAWCAIPLFYAGLRTLPPRAAVAVVVVLTVLVVAAQLRFAGRFDPNLLFAPPAVAALATTVFLQAQRQAARQRDLIDDLLRTRRELAASERREGVFAERQRLSMEIHDSLAQGLSSQRMLLQAAERVWEGDPAKARAHVRSAASVAEHNLAGARRFVCDLAPADLAGDGGLGAALRALAARESGGPLGVRVHVDDGGRAPELPERVQSALLRIAQGALANVREHAAATTAALTLTLLDDRVVLDIADDGHGFAPAARSGAASGLRGYGLPAMRARVRQLGGALTVESAPGEGTVLSVVVTLETPHDQESGAVR
ncbi:sensor histidine kinase [Streptomyces shenzhenensis]|uniref:Two-component sensor histidine kinase n=1 Tax=Streptomyces shenzhenensis TaxID=943815 RepID=A0A3M0I447_9ACTN|nr:histidine kinase [Streptomyces shenzhenensis]RMB81553.1 two-component sensor histidine kinase [Streptomyces shenzhenensis]